MGITIKCPHCEREVSLQPAQDIESKNITCAECKKASKFREYLPKYSLRIDNKNYQLYFGQQWIGRQYEGSDTDIQIPDDTKYMSRKHGLIDLRIASNSIVCCLEEHGKNPTVKDGVELTKGDIVYLNVNDCLTLGDTRMYLVAEYGSPAKEG